MKRKCKLLIAGAALALSSTAAMAAVEDVTGTFQWIGTVPTSIPGTEWKIINTGTVNHLAGTVTFSGNDADGYEVVDSSELKFSVVTIADDTPAPNFDYTLTNLIFSAGGGFMTSVTNEFTITADGTPLVQNAAATTKTGGGDVALKVQAGTTTATLTAGDEVVIQAVILVNNQA